jgi:REP element-mobilizing transposase RayT
MARSIRLEFEGAFYHVMARGDRREAIFLDDHDRRFFLQCLADAREKTGWMVHAWVLMDNLTTFSYRRLRRIWSRG